MVECEEYFIRDNLIVLLVIYVSININFRINIRFVKIESSVIFNYYKEIKVIKILSFMISDLSPWCQPNNDSILIKFLWFRFQKVDRRLNNW